MSTPITNIALAEWQKVPERVAELTPKAIAAAHAHVKAADACGILTTASASWSPESNAIYIHVDQLPGPKVLNTYFTKIAGAYEVIFSVEPPDFEHNILVKKATWFPGVNKGWQYANAALGGPTPLSNAIVTGLALGGLGYGAGTLAEQVIPERFLERGSLRKPLAILGALGGLGTGALNASATHSLFPENGYWRAWITNNRTNLPKPEPEVPAPDAQKAAMFGFNNNTSFSGISKPTIPVDAFNRATWADASKNYDQSSYVNHTSPQIAAATTGILSGIKQQTGSNIISPSTVIKGLASAGVGLATATVAGKAIGALANLTPVAQENIQNMGLWGGLLHAVIPPALNW
jgi:hypothetical protein